MDIRRNGLAGLAAVRRVDAGERKVARCSRHAPHRRRRALGRLAACAALAAFAVAVPAAHAEAFPSRPIHLVVTGVAGSSSDIVARRLGKLIQEDTGASVVVDNRAGASGSIGLLQTIHAPADGYNLVIAVPDSTTIYPLLKKVRPYSIEKDLTPIAQVAETHFVFAVSVKNPAANLADFIAQAKRRPAGARLNYASPGNATSGRLVTEMLMARSGIEMVHVPYRSTMPGLVGVVGGETEIMATSIASAKSLVDSQQLKLIGVTREQRIPGFENVPTANEVGLDGFVAGVWWGIFAPAKLPADVRDRLAAIVSKAATSDEMKAQLVSLGLEPRLRTGPDFSAYLARDSRAWQDVLRRVDLPLED